jgi:hypothetical protein
MGMSRFSFILRLSTLCALVDVPSEEGKNMRRTALALVVTLALTVLLFPQSALAAKPRVTCSPGFNLGALTFEQAVALPATQRGLADGVFTLDDIRAGFDSVDANDNNLVCFQDVFSIAGERPNPASLLQYFFNIVDDQASTP